MSPFIGGLAIVAGAIAVAVVVGAAGGAIHGRLKGDLSVGAILTLAAYALVVIALESWSARKIIVLGMFPLMLTFLPGSLATRFLESRCGLRPMMAALAGLCVALLVGLAYLMLIRFNYRPLVDPGTAWIALAAISLLVLSSVWKRMRLRRRTPDPPG